VSMTGAGNEFGLNGTESEARVVVGATTVAKESTVSAGATVAVATEVDNGVGAMGSSPITSCVYR